MLVFDAASPLERIKLSAELTAKLAELSAPTGIMQKVSATARVAAILKELGAETPDDSSKGIRNFGWDAVKLSSLSFDALSVLRSQVMAEHANPRDEYGRYLENGKPSLYLYDKNGRKKLDALAWAVAYKKGEKVSPIANESSGIRAPSGGVVGKNGEFYRGGTFLPSTTLPKQGSSAKESGEGNSVLIEPNVFSSPPSAGAKSIFANYREFIHVTGGVASVYERSDAAIAANVDSDIAEGRAFLQAAARAYNSGMRWFLPNDIKATDADYADPQYSIIEHVTGKGKTIRGIVRTDLSYAEAKAIDEYTFKKDGGYFIREKHLAGYEPSNNPKPEKPSLTPEQITQTEAEKAAKDQERTAEKRKEQAASLRKLAQATIEKAEEEIGRDRNTNTSRRASMAAGVIERHEASRAIGKTMLNIAEAIESGQAKLLSGITSRAAVEQLQASLLQGKYRAETAENLSYADRQKQEGRPLTVNDARNAEFPAAKWGAAGTSRSKALEAIKGKRGSVDLARKISYSNGPDAEMLKSLRAMLGDKMAKELLGWWSIEQIAKAERLRRSGITNTDELRAALVEFLDVRSGARKEDPIKAAERAIIGQKVGVDFFPTPSVEAQRMVRLADIQPGERVLEPSAGNGNIADAAAAAGGKVDVLEISSQLRDILQAKGYNIVGHDFETFQPEEKYDAILMNPPWSNRMDAAHIRRAFDMLRTGGRLVAIAGEGVFFGSDKAAVEFREWLEEHSAEVEQLPKGTFTDTKLLARTSANGRLLVMEKG